MMCNDQYPDTQCLNEGVCVEVVKSITVQIKQDHTDHSTHARSIRNFRYLKRSKDFFNIIWTSWPRTPGTDDKDKNVY